MRDIVYRVETIGQLHDIIGFEKPRHPLISVIDYAMVKVANAPEKGSFVCDFYAVNFKKYCQFVYGRQPFDHQEGTLHCVAPGQVITFDRTMEEGSSEGWGLYFHPELIRGSTLGNKMRDYSFFSYGENEALHLSDQEKQILMGLLKQMENEYHTNIDQYSQELILSNIELLLNYCRRFYGRQFITRANQHRDVVAQFEDFIAGYIHSPRLRTDGIPSVRFCAEAMNLSPNYFSDLLKSETGKNTQEYIHFYLLERAKTILESSDKNINEIAYDLGFEYPQSFSAFFKKKVGVSPTDFRNEMMKN